MVDLHRDRYRLDWFNMQRIFMGRIDPDEAGLAEINGTASYTEVSEPHSLAECPHRDG